MSDGHHTPKPRELQLSATTNAICTYHYCDMINSNEETQLLGRLLWRLVNGRLSGLLAMVIIVR
jgi:hypothetical protein